MEFLSIKYSVSGRIATITLNRALRFNAIDKFMPQEISNAVELANEDNNVHVIVLTGEGKAFCSGYDLLEYAQSKGSKLGGDDENSVWDPMADFYGMFKNTQYFMSLWRSYKPTIAKVNGMAVGGGSDIALCCDLVIMSDEAKIGYPPSRIWGCPTTAMWFYRLGAEKAKRMLLTGDLITGKEAVKLGLCLESVPAENLDARVNEIANRMASVPRNQLMMQKLMINQVYENMGISNTQMMATLFDGIARHSPEGVWFKKLCEEKGWKYAVQKRDGGENLALNVSKPWSKL